jgi:hypothetical protein
MKPEIRTERTIQHADSLEELGEIIDRLRRNGVHYYEVAFVKCLNCYMVLA